MLGFLPDPILVEVLGQGSGQPCRIRLTLPDGSGVTGDLDLAALSARPNALLEGSDPEALQEYGQFLFNSLFPGNCSGQYLAALKAARERGIRLSLCLDEHVPSLHRVPWECLFHPQGNQWAPLATASNVYLSRYLQAGQPWGLPLPDGRLRVLVVISSPFPPGNDLHVNVGVEQAALEEVFRPFAELIEVEVLAGPVTAKQLSDRLNQGAGFDVLHYIGHGDFREDQQTGYLILSRTYEDGSPGPTGVSAGELNQSLSGCPHLPQLIFLNACKSGQPSTLDAFAGVGPQLVAAGCPAVICMQAIVEMAAARLIAGIFYENLLETGCVDLAVNRARAALRDNPYGQWAVPVVYMRLTDGILFEPERRFRAAQRQPYRFLAPYQGGDFDLFKGRKETVAEVTHHIRENPVTIIYGEEGVGLTSLLEAGIRPELEGDGWLVVSISRYHDLAGEFRVRIQVDGRPFVLHVPGDAPLEDLLRAVSPGRFTRLALILDQFERVFDLEETGQQAILQTLLCSLQTLGNRLSLVLAIHKDALPGMVRFQELTSNRIDDWIEVHYLNLEETVEAIIGPLDALGWPVTLNPALAREQIAPDLCDISEGCSANGKKMVDPGKLQITCTWLYRKARGRHPPLIDSDLYIQEAGGAEGILVRYMEEELKTQFTGQADLAKSILVRMAGPDQEHWVSPEQITLLSTPAQPQSGKEQTVVPPETIRALLNRLVKAELLVRRMDPGGYVYAFPNETIADEVRRIAGKEVQEKYLAGDELERIWRLWLAEQVRAHPGSHTADRVLATRYQLRLMQASKQVLDARPVKILMLLRSAVLRGEPVASWLDCLRKADGGIELVRALELPSRDPNHPAASASPSLNLAQRLLGLDNPGLPKISDSGSGYGDASWAAVAGNDPVDRRTAALALTVLPPETASAWARLTLALEDLRPRARSSLRRYELFGTLADAGLETERLQKSSPGTRLGIYLWRAWRRIQSHSRGILLAALGSGIGGGLGLGIERLLFGQAAQSHVGVIYFALFSYWGLILAGMTGLGEEIGTFLLSGNASTRRRQLLAARITLGTLFFGVANFVVAVLNYISLAAYPLVVPFGFVAGLGMGIALSGDASAPTLKRPLSWLLPAVLAGLIFALVQAFFLLFPTMGSGISIALSASYIEVEFDSLRGTILSIWPFIAKNWPALLALIESGCSGFALALGALAGRSLASRWNATYEKMRERMGE